MIVQKKKPPETCTIQWSNINFKISVYLALSKGSDKKSLLVLVYAIYHVL